MAFKIIFTDKARETYGQCIGYILFRFRDKFAAERLEKAIGEALDILKESPKSYPFYDECDFAKRGIRKIHLRKSRYKILYHLDIVNGVEVVVIDIILHDLQDVSGKV